MKILTQGFERYLKDESNTSSSNIDKIYLPENARDVAIILKDCPEVTVFGGGTGITGGATSGHGVILSTEKLNYLKIEKDRKKAWAGPGVLLKDLNAQLKKCGLWYPVDSTEQTATIGGNAATNASGARSFKYGSIRNFVGSIETVFPLHEEPCTFFRGDVKEKGNKMVFHILTQACEVSFDILDTASRFPAKNNAGYYMSKDMDIIDLLVGSEGTLGVMAGLELKVMEIPYEITAFMAYFDSVEDAFNLVKTIKKGPLEYSPCSVEFFDRASLEFLKGHGKKVKIAEAAIFIEVEARSKKEEEEIFGFVAGLFEVTGINTDDIMASSTKEKKNFIYDIREALPQLVNEHIRGKNLRKVSTDFAVKDEKIDEMAALYKKMRAKAGVRSVMFGHAGDNNLHINFLPENGREFERAKEIYREAAVEICKMGGTIASEHGVGKLKKEYMKYMYSAKEMETMRNIKKAFDPRMTLNRGNIFD